MTVRVLSSTFRVILLVLLIHKILSKTDKEWQFNSNIDQDFDNVLNFDDLEKMSKDCINDNECKTMEQNFVKNEIQKRKSKLNPAVATIFASENVPSLLNHFPKSNFHTVIPKTCQCGMENRLLDLGPLYMPRYLSTGVCSDDACHNGQRCRPKLYKLRVLKHREAEVNELLMEESVDLPGLLGENWTMNAIRVTVACECK